MAYNNPNTGTALTPRPDLLNYMSASQAYAFDLKSAGFDSDYMSGISYPNRNTFMIEILNRQMYTLFSYSGSLTMTPLSTAANFYPTYDVTGAQPILYVNLGDVGELIDNSPLGAYEMIFDPNISIESPLRSWTRGEVEQYRGWKYIKGVEWYDNSNNGNYNLYNPRTVLANTATNRIYDIVFPFYCSSIVFSDDRRVDVDTTAALAMSGNVIMYPYFNKTVDQTNFMPYFANTISSRSPFGAIIQTLTSATQSNKYTIFPEPQTIANFFALWGLNVFFTLDEALTSNIPVVGQPSNPDPNDTPTGTGDNSSDDVIIPSISHAPLAAYNKLWIDENTVVALRQYLFGDTFLNDIRKLWSNALDAVISLVWYPFNPIHVHNLSIRLEDTAANIGNIQGIESVKGYPMILQAANDSTYIDMGYIDVEPYFGRYLDYTGYTDITVYIPYAGEYKLETSEVMGKRLKLIYYLDVAANSFLATLYADGQPIGQYTGSMGVQIPLSGTMYNEYYKEILGKILNAHTNITSSAAGGAIAGGAGGAIAGAGSSAIGSALDIATTVPHAKQIGSLSPSSAIYAPQVPYICISRPYMSRPTAWETLHGNAAGFSTIVGDCTGYIEAEEVQLLSNEIMTAEEQNEIENLLKGGIYA